MLPPLPSVLSDLGRNFARWPFLYDDGRHDGDSDVRDAELVTICRCWWPT